MTFTSRIRLFLLLVAILPSLAIIIGIYLYVEKQIELSDRQLAHQSLERFITFNDTFISEIKTDIEALLKTDYVSHAIALIQSNRAKQVKLTNSMVRLDFLEILDSNYIVQASYHRPGMLGAVLPGIRRFSNSKPEQLHMTVEYDINGPHAAYAYLIPVNNTLYIYTGRYLDNRFINFAQLLLGADVKTIFNDSNNMVFSRMQPQHLYQTENHLQAVLTGSKKGGFFIVADFPGGIGQPVFQSLLFITILVATASVLLALVLGFYITGKAKREIDNLIDATTRVASGDFSSPVMAYEEGEFAQLADSFTDMTFKLKSVQQQLTTSEKIAAWQVMGRKIAHEIKNPLTPIAISADDLRRSYQEQTPDFNRVLDETTRTIKSEVMRLTRLLDQFVSFARMSPPKISSVSLSTLLKDIITLYHREYEQNRLSIQNHADKDVIQADADMIKQVLVNLIKNSFETGTDIIVTITCTRQHDKLTITIEDNGPGFPAQVLKTSPQPYVSTKKNGSGLGLVICQRIVHDHGGTMQLYNCPEGGAGVKIVLPQ